MSRIFRFVLLVLMAFAATACPEDAENDKEVTCIHGEATYQVDESFPAGDGCNLCSCGADGEVTCTAMACTTGCDYNNIHYQPDDSFTATDGCNTCICAADGTIACTEMDCVGGCAYNGQVYQPGDTFKDEDGCNDCSCQDDGTVACTLMACVVTCEYDGSTYTAGDFFVATDGCNSCTCDEDGNVVCDQMGCVDGCEYNGQVYQPGISFKDEEGCNTCTCQEDGTVACTDMACTGLCEYDGSTYSAGDSFEATDGCNTCTCGEDGSVACTEMGCAVVVCEYNGVTYAVGDTFEATDGCNTCACREDGGVACTKMACPTGECTDGLMYFEPGCGTEDGMPVIESGCFAGCNGSPCETGICQLTDINPCICGPEDEACCAACGSHEWLCLDAPETCASLTGAPMISAVGKSFGECMGQCKFDLVIAAGKEGGCMEATLTSCGWTADESCAPEKIGVLTPVGQAKAYGLAAELMGAELEATYGCPDCADGGASQLTIQTADGVATALTYEYGNPPYLLVRVDAFTQGLMESLDTCAPNDDIVISAADCIPRD